MNTYEYEALNDSELSHEAVVLYVRFFAFHCDYETGLVSVNLRSLGEHLEHTPPIGSTLKTYKPTKDKVRNLLKQLTKKGLIRCVEKGDRASRKPAVFLCVLRSKNKQKSPSEEHHENTTWATPQEQSQKKQQKHNVVEFPEGRNPMRTPREEPHRSIYIDKDKDIYARAREDLEFSKSFTDIAAQIGLVVDHEELECLFDTFRFSTKFGNEHKPITQWLVQWRSYLATVKLNKLKESSKPNAGSNNHANRSSNRRSGNATNFIFENAKRVAAECPDDGEGFGILDEINEFTRSASSTQTG